ncbi:MAG: phosphoenolpyruvate carboxykinase (GTP), partial [Kiritimatiellae bacterium]|nr:phosphoenolpyruvate carboxykinase (GTP) [Kiritimatiellia bacterium]
MLPFCGYNIGDYFAHWLKMGRKEPSDKLPKIFYVNWFRKSPEGKFLWPGFGDNSRVLKWVFDRVTGAVGAEETPIGLMPKQGDLDVTGLDLPAGAMDELLSVDIEGWKQEAASIREHLESLGEHVPQELKGDLEALEERLNKA